MTSTRDTLQRFRDQLDESIGLRDETSQPQLSPRAQAKDVGRRSLRSFGTLPLDQIIPDPDQPRREFAEAELEQLAGSLRDHGQLHPLRVRWSEENGKWVIISGERRYRAARRAGLPSLQCHFEEDALPRDRVLQQQLIENLLREDLGPVEQAQAFAELIRLNGWTSKQLAEAIHVNPSKVSRALALLKLPADVQELVESGKLAARAAYELSKLDSERQIRDALAGQAGRNDGAAPARGTTIAQATGQRRKRQGKRAAGPRGVQQTFVTEGGWKITASLKRKSDYFELEQALEEVLEEVRLRIRNRVFLA